MTSSFPNDHDLNQRLDQAVPPHTRTMGTADTDPLIAVAQRLAQGPNVNFSQVALDRIEAQLQAQMDTMPQYQVRRKRHLIRVLPYAAALILVFCLTLTMAGRAAASSLPGDNLYPVKRMLEGIQLALTSEDNKAEFHITLAEHRADEFAALLEQGRVYPQALVEANDELNRAVDLLAAGQGSWSEVRSRVIDLVDYQNTLLLAVQQQASADEQVRLLVLISDQAAVQQRLETLDAPSTPLVLTLTPSATQPATASPTTTPNLATPTMTDSPTTAPSQTATASPTKTLTPTVRPTTTNSPTATPSPTTTATRTKTPRPTRTVTNSPTATPSPTLQPPPSRPTMFVEQPTASGAGNPGYGQGNGSPESTPPVEPGGSSDSGQGNNSQGGNPPPNGSSNGGNHP